MKRNILSLLALLALAAAEPPVDPGMSQRVAAHVSTLASDAMEGRGMGTPGHERAAAYVADQYKAMGLEPAGDNGSYYQWVPFRRATLDKASVKASLLLRGRRMRLGDRDIRPRASVAMRDLRLDAPLVFVGFGIRDPILGIDDYQGLDVRGKIVVAFRGAPPQYDADIRAHLDATKDEVAASAGAAGFVMLSTQREARLARSPRPIDQIAWVGADGSAGLPADRLPRFALSEKSANALFAGAPTSLAAARRAAISKGSPIARFDLPARLDIAAHSDWQEFRSPQVVGMIRGGDTRLRHEHVLMMGHLDHLGIDPDTSKKDRIYNGAIDNASGIAALIEAARGFTGKQPPRRSILFIAHTGEEEGLLGSDYFARHPTVPLKSIVAAVDLDMPVPLYHFVDVVPFGAGYSSLVENVRAAASEMGVGVAPDPMPEEGIFTRSDHYRFVEQGIPAILLFTGYGETGKASWNRFFNDRYHSASDDLMQPLLWDELARFAEINRRIAASLADAPSRPRWYAGNYFAKRFGGLGETSVPAAAATP